jgi:putative acyl-CoA dehydrogenase
MSVPAACGNSILPAPKWHSGARGSSTFSSRLATICGGPGNAAADTINRSLGREERESHARIVAEKLGRLGALAALHETNDSLAEAYAAMRLQGAPHATFGACDLQAVQSFVLSRVLPP